MKMFVMTLAEKKLVHFLLGATTLSIKRAALPVVIRICFLADGRHHIYLGPPRRNIGSVLMTLESLEP